VLILGSHAAGKTTIVKHLQLLFNQFETKLSRATQAHLVRGSVNAHLQAALQIVKDYAVLHPNALDQKSLHFVHTLDVSKGISPEVAQLLQAMSKDGLLADVEKATAGAFDAKEVSYCAQLALRSAEPDFLPSDSEILRLHWQTSGHTTTRIPMSGMTLELTDVGGIVTERRKWTALFQPPGRKWDRLIFVAALDS